MSPEKEQLVIAAFNAGQTCRHITKTLGIGRNAASATLRKYGLTPRTGRPPSCTLDHEAFNSLTPTSMYWMGFLFADGSVATGGGAPQLILDIGTKDRGHIEAFRTFLKSDHAISDVTHKASTYGDITVRERKSVAFRVRSQPLIDALGRQGLVAGKKQRIPSATLARSPDFWRGCVDGDGTVGIYPDKCGYLYPVLKLCGQLKLIQVFQSFLRQHNISMNITKTSSGIFQIQMMGSLAKKMIAVLYHGNLTIALERKLTIVKSIF